MCFPQRTCGLVEYLDRPKSIVWPLDPTHRPGIPCARASCRYTANLAAILGRKEVVIPNRDVYECNEKRCKFCSSDHEPTLDQLKIYFPDLNLLTNSTWKNVPRWDGLAQGGALLSECDATWAYKFSQFRFGTHYNSEPCNQNLAGGQLFSMPLALPITREYANSFSTPPQCPTSRNFVCLTCVNTEFPTHAHPGRSPSDGPR